MDQIKTTKNHHYQQLARQDVLFRMFVTLDTTHWLMSALNEEAPLKAVVFGRRKKKGSDVNMDQIKTTKVQTAKGGPKNNKGSPLSTIGKERLTVVQGRHI